MDKIKLLIWDLDETFWKGTLSEEGIVPIEANIQLVKELTDKGIMNSIVSKNNFEQAKAKLTELGVWDYFIFPAIEWAPKGVAVKNIISNCQLRDVNVLFLDDNHLNLKEAKFYNPNLHIQEPDFIPQILTHEAFKGKDDSTHSRLKQYKILEEKASAMELFDDNIAFLESSNIKIEFIQDLDAHKERILELLSRTNQLNFTKIRSKQDELEELLNNEAMSSCLIKVKDDFGDYGIVGFYSIDRAAKHLKHFVFSCRILNLGIVQYVYAKLNFPSLNIVPEVAEELDNSSPDWITEISGDSDSQKQEKDSLSQKRTKIFFKGGCDLSQMLFYLEGKNFSIKEESNYVSADNFPIHQEHTQVLLDSLNLPEEHKDYVQTCNYIPFADKNFYTTKLFDFDYDCLIFSVLMDYTNDIYEHKGLGIKLPYGGYYRHWTDTNNHEEIVEVWNRESVNAQGLATFAQEFKLLGQISPEEFLKNLSDLRKLIPASIPIVFINGTEIPPLDKKEAGSLERHKVMNAHLDNFVENHTNTFLLDVRDIVKNQSQLTNNIRHYNREAYKNLSAELLKLLNEILPEEIETNLGIKTEWDYWKSNLNEFVGKVKNKIGRIV